MSKAEFTNYAGLNYGTYSSNLDVKTSIRYGVINQNEVGQAWFDEAEAWYGDDVEYMKCSECGEEHSGKLGEIVECKCGEEFELELPEYAEPISFIFDGDGYQAKCGEDGDIFIIKSPYFTYAQFCSPCAPGACYLMNPLEDPIENNKCYCFDHDWFEDGEAPYPVYSVKTGELIKGKVK